MTTISAKSILRSRNTAAPECVLSTLLLRYPRWVHAEFMTHRVFSRNAASSRAIPVSKLIDDVMSDPAVPLFWGKNQKGMQAAEECASNVRIATGDRNIAGFAKETFASREKAWLAARDHAVEIARGFADAGYHKQLVNRLLEPFVHITVLVSSTQWANFLALRDHADAEPHIAMLARAVRQELDTAPIQDLAPGFWHQPFVERDDIAVLAGYSFEVGGTRVPTTVKKSVACCASTSYKTVDGFDMTMDRAVAIHDRLLSSAPVHASPAEHAAQADSLRGPDTIEPRPIWDHGWQHGNFVGFRQYRKMLPNEAVHG